MAVRVGLAIATGDIILIPDADPEYDPLAAGPATVVYGSRFMGTLKGMNWKNWLANKILSVTANVLFDCNLTDEATAYKAFRRETLADIKLPCHGFEFCPEVTAKVRRAGHRIHEVPISYNARGIHEGKKIRWQHGFEAMWTVFKYRVAPLNSFAEPRKAHAGASWGTLVCGHWRC